MEEKNKKRIWDKLIMGAVIGGAIGSVIGASVAPEKGKTTRRKIKDFIKRKLGLDKKEEQIESLKKIPEEKPSKSGFFINK